VPEIYLPTASRPGVLPSRSLYPSRTLLPPLRLPQPFGRRHPPAVAEQLPDLSPIGPPVQPHADPAARPHIRRHGEPLRTSLDHEPLVVRTCLAPESRTALGVVAAGRGVHREQLVPDPEGRFTPGLDFVRFGQSQAETAETGQRRWWHR